MPARRMAHPLVRCRHVIAHSDVNTGCKGLASLLLMLLLMLLVLLHLVSAAALSVHCITGAMPRPSVPVPAAQWAACPRRMRSTLLGLARQPF